MDAALLGEPTVSVVVIVKGPYLQWPTTSSVTVMWETQEETCGTVEWFETQAVHSSLSGRARTLTSSKRSVTDDYSHSG